MRGATCPGWPLLGHLLSTHVLHMKYDVKSTRWPPASFQFTHPDGCDGGCCCHAVFHGISTPTTHVGCGSMLVAGKTRSGFQLTHPVRGTTSSICCRDGSNRISTHTPAWGATRLTVTVVRVLQISTHAPRDGVRPDRRRRFRWSFDNFNSRSPRGVRR